MPYFQRKIRHSNINFLSDTSRTWLDVYEVIYEVIYSPWCQRSSHGEYITSYTWHVTHLTRRIWSYIWSHIWSHIWLFVCTDSYCITMGWLRSVGSIKSQVSFAKEPYKRDNILQKRPVIWSILLTLATPYEAPKSWCLIARHQRVA